MEPFEQEVGEIKKTLDDLRSKLDSVEQERNNLQIEVTSKSAKLEDLNKTNANLEDNLEELEQVRKNLEMEVSSKDDKIKVLEDMMKKANDTSKDVSIQPRRVLEWLFSMVFVYFLATFCHIQ